MQGQNKIIFDRISSWLERNWPTSIVVDGVKFSGLKRTLCGTNSIGYSRDYVIKIEHAQNPRKLNNLFQEAQIISELNSKGCVSCPSLISTGTLSSGESYIILERIHPRGHIKTADMLLSLLEQKSLGIYQGDFKPENMVFDGSICFLVDYDQAQKREAFAKMGNVEFIKWLSLDFKQRRNQDFFTQKDRKFNEEEFLGYFEHDSFNMTSTSVLANQVTTHTKSGIYHKLDYPQIHACGARNLSDRKPILDKIEFKADEAVLDIGCNLGLLCHYLHDRKCKVVGIDMDPDVIRAAKIVANIICKSIDFQCMDMSNISRDGQFDTICLFSVFHHIKNIRQAAKYINRAGKRVILESRLLERGSIPIKRKWKKTNKWKFDTVSDLSSYVEKLLPSFKLEKNWGQCDRGRLILSFLRK